MDWVALFWIMVFTGGFCFLLVFGELFMNALYEFFPPYRRWFDKQLEKCPIGTRRWRNDNPD